MRGNGKNLQKFSQVVRVYRNGATLTVTELAAELRRDAAGVRQQVQELHDTGLLYITGWKCQRLGYASRVYAWAEPFGRPDEIQSGVRPNRAGCPADVVGA